MTTDTTPDTRPLVTLDEESHIYTHRDGHRPPGVTSILNSVPPWSTRFDRAKSSDVAYKGDLGRQVHRATQYFDEDLLDWDSVDPVLVPYIDAWALFRREKRFQPVQMEQAVYHPIYGYAGTLDRIGIVDDTPVLLDLKSGDGSMAGPQTAAYLEAWSAMQHSDRPDHALVFMPRWSVQLLPTGKYAITEHKSRRDFRVFLAAFEIFNFNRSPK